MQIHHKVPPIDVNYSLTLDGVLKPLSEYTKGIFLGNLKIDDWKDQDKSGKALGANSESRNVLGQHNREQEQTKGGSRRPSILDKQNGMDGRMTLEKSGKKDSKIQGKENGALTGFQTLQLQVQVSKPEAQEQISPCIFQLPEGMVQEQTAEKQESVNEDQEDMSIRNCAICRAVSERAQSQTGSVVSRKKGKKGGKDSNGVEELVSNHIKVTAGNQATAMQDSRMRDSFANQSRVTAKQTTEQKNSKGMDQLINQNKGTGKQITQEKDSKMTASLANQTKADGRQTTEKESLSGVRQESSVHDCAICRAVSEKAQSQKGRSYIPMFRGVNPSQVDTEEEKQMVPVANLRGVNGVDAGQDAEDGERHYARRSEAGDYLNTNEDIEVNPKMTASLGYNMNMRSKSKEPNANNGDYCGFLLEKIEELQKISSEKSFDITASQVQNKKLWEMLQEKENELEYLRKKTAIYGEEMEFQNKSIISLVGKNRQLEALNNPGRNSTIVEILTDENA